MCQFCTHRVKNFMQTKMLDFNTLAAGGIWTGDALDIEVVKLYSCGTSIELYLDLKGRLNLKLKI